MRDGLLFVNAVAKSKEENLFSEERLSRLIDAEKLDDAVKILVEAGYGGGAVVDDPKDFEEILSSEEKILNEFVSSIELNGAGFECFYIKADYHNAKAILKGLYAGGTNEDALMDGGLYAVSELKEKINSDSPEINPYLDEAVKAVKRSFENTVSPRLIDTLVDKAMYSDIASRLNNAKTDALIKTYFAAMIDCLNAASFVRSVSIGANLPFFVSNIIDGGTIDEKTLAGLYPDINKMRDKLKFSGYDSFSEKLSIETLPEFDAARDDYLINLFRTNRSDMFSVAPVMGYYLGKLNEIKVLRIVLVCIKNGVDKKEIKKRLRSMYA